MKVDAPPPGYLSGIVGMETNQAPQIEIDDRALEHSQDIQALQTLSMVVVSDGTNAGATARSGMSAVKMCG
jgi:predicted phosphoribosyltransferase